MKVDLDRIDRLRERVDMSYEEAVTYLEAAGGDLVKALIMAERHKGQTQEPSNWHGSDAADDTLVARQPSSLDRIADGVKDLLNQGASFRFIVERDGERLANLPVAAGLIGAAFAPHLAAIGAVAALATGCYVKVEKR